MNRKGSIVWIVFLLAAMFLGPTLILNRFVPEGAEQPELRVLIEQERLIDALRNIPLPIPKALPPASDSR